MTVQLVLIVGKQLIYLTNNNNLQPFKWSSQRFKEQSRIQGNPLEEIKSDFISFRFVWP